MLLEHIKQNLVAYLILVFFSVYTLSQLIFSEIELYKIMIWISIFLTSFIIFLKFPSNIKVRLIEDPIPYFFIFLYIIYFIIDLSIPPIYLEIHPLFIIILFLSSLFYLVTKNRLSKIKEISIINEKYMVSLVLLFFIFFFLSIIELKSSFYYRTFLFFLLVSFCSIPIFIQIISNSNRRLWILVIILEIFLVSFILRSSIYFLADFYYGDALFHETIIDRIVNTGFPLEHSYKNWPVMHILLSLPRIISDISVSNTYYLFSFTLESLIPIVIFLIAKEFLDYKKSLLSGLMSAYIGNLYYYGTLLIPQSLAILIFSISVYFLVKSRNNKKFLILFFISSVSLILTHSLSSLIFSFCLIFLCSYLYIVHSSRKEENNYLSITILFTIILLSYWVYAASIFYQEVLDSARFALENAYVIESAEFEKMPLEIERDNFFSSMVNFPQNITLFLSSFSIFHWLRKKRLNIGLREITLIFYSSLILFNFVFSSTGMFSFIRPFLGGFLPHRWFPFSDIFASVLIANTLFYFISNKRSQIVISCMVLFLVLISVLSVSLDFGWPFHEIEKLNFNRISEINPIFILNEKNIQYIYTDVQISRYMSSLTNLTNSAVRIEDFDSGLSFPLYMYRSIYSTGMNVFLPKGRLYSSSFVYVTEEIIPKTRDRILDNGEAYILY